MTDDANFIRSGAAAAAGAQRRRSRNASRSSPRSIATCRMAQHMGDRFLVGYPYEGEWHKPNMKVVSLYVDQKPEGDLSGDARAGIRLQGLSDHCRGAALRRRQSWPWMRC